MISPSVVCTLFSKRSATFLKKYFYQPQSKGANTFGKINYLGALESNTTHFKEKTCISFGEGFSYLYNEPLHGVLGSRENGGQNNQGAGSRVGNGVGSREQTK